MNFYPVSRPQINKNPEKAETFSGYREIMIKGREPYKSKPPENQSS